jgi:cell division septation protein DedD
VIQRIFALDAPVPADEVEDVPEEEFELVMGRRQVAALVFLALVMVALCSGGSYLAGKALAPREEAAAGPAEQTITIEQPPPASVSTAAPILEATIVNPPAFSLARPGAEAPLFASPNPKAIYIQVGAVEKGVAVILAEGLRKHSLDSFVAPGPSEKSMRVLIGPFADAEAYQKARDIVDKIGLANFARRYQQD